MKCAKCPVNDGYCVFVDDKRKRCPIPLLRDRKIKSKKAPSGTLIANHKLECKDADTKQSNIT